jgi:regulator of cell morphogenesis and NO signaling
MNIQSTSTVGDLAVRIPGATRVFEKLGIDYCCGGHRRLDEVCRISNLPVEQVIHSLAEADKRTAAKPENPDWQQTSLVALQAYIVDFHHSFTRKELNRLEPLLEKVCTVHGQGHPELVQLQTLFQRLKEDLLPHMLKEEQVLFPYIEKLEAAAMQQTDVAKPFFATVQNPVRMMMFEHEAVGEILAEMGRLTNGFTVPAEGCISYQTLYDALREFEADIHQHIHLENNLLFPRAISLESSLK